MQTSLGKKTKNACLYGNESHFYQGEVQYNPLAKAIGAVIVTADKGVEEEVNIPL